MYEDEYYSEIEDVTILQEELPLRPYCSDDLKKGLRIRPRLTALKKKYIQLNPPHQRAFLTFDLDYPTWAYVAEDVNLPQPIWCVGNEKNGHAHLIYALKYPVCTTSAAHLKPLRWLVAIEAAMSRKLGADPMYSGLISKNPWSSEWRVTQTGNTLYTLENLSEHLSGYVDLLVKAPRGEIIGLGRNCTVFENVRRWAYREIRRGYWREIRRKLPKKGLFEAKNYVELLGMICDVQFLSDMSSVELLREPVELPRMTGYNEANFGDEEYRELPRMTGYDEAHLDERYEAWENAVMNRCYEENAKFSEPLSESELRGIAKSISRWVWIHINPDGFSDWQRKNVTHRWDKESKKKEGLELLKSGMSVLAVSRFLGVSVRSCYRWKTLLIQQQKDFF